MNTTETSKQGLSTRDPSSPSILREKRGQIYSKSNKEQNEYNQERRESPSCDEVFPNRLGFIEGTDWRIGDKKEKDSRYNEIAIGTQPLRLYTHDDINGNTADGLLDIHTVTNHQTLPRDQIFGYPFEVSGLNLVEDELELEKGLRGDFSPHQGLEEISDPNLRANNQMSDMYDQLVEP